MRVSRTQGYRQASPAEVRHIEGVDSEGLHEGHWILNFMNAYQLSFEDLRVQVGPTAPGFGQRGGGTQYLSPLSTDMIEKLGLIKDVRQ